MAFICSGKKRKHCREFKTADALQTFDSAFADESDYRILWRIGFTAEQIDQLLKDARAEDKQFHKSPDLL